MYKRWREGEDRSSVPGALWGPDWRWHKLAVSSSALAFWGWWGALRSQVCLQAWRLLITKPSQSPLLGVSLFWRLQLVGGECALPTGISCLAGASRSRLSLQFGWSSTISLHPKLGVPGDYLILSGCPTVLTPVSTPGLWPAFGHLLRAWRVHLRPTEEKTQQSPVLRWRRKETREWLDESLVEDDQGS